MSPVRTTFGVLSFAIVAFACGGSGGGAVGPSGASGAAPPPSGPQGAPRCGVRTFGSKYDPRCQQLADDRCCMVQQRCAADPTCARAAQCLSDCARPDNERCMLNCLSMPGMTKAAAETFMLTVQCVVADPIPTGISGANCNWPEGGLAAGISLGHIAQPFHRIHLNANGMSDTVLIDPVGNVFRDVHPWNSNESSGLRYVRTTSPALAARIGAQFAALPRQRQEPTCTRGNVDFDTAQGNQHGFGGGFLSECFNPSGRLSNPATERAFLDLYNLVR